MYYNAPLLYEQAYSITINNAEAPLYYFFDYDERSYNINICLLYTSCFGKCLPGCPAPYR